MHEHKQSELERRVQQQQVSERLNDRSASPASLRSLSLSLSQSIWQILPLSMTHTCSFSCKPIALDCTRELVCIPNQTRPDRWAGPLGKRWIDLPGFSAELSGRSKEVLLARSLACSLARLRDLHSTCLDHCRELAARLELDASRTRSLSSRLIR